MGLAAALTFWRMSDEVEVEHSHDDLADDDPHIKEGHYRDGHEHVHALMIDRQQPDWLQER
ncbi:MAG: hypothetical protein U5N27_19240 [Rhizobium sp.]|nr:hypothetical protein [Rhizobium sp.]